MTNRLPCGCDVGDCYCDDCAGRGIGQIEPRPLQLIQLPPPEEGERRHTFGAMDDAQGLRLLESSGCDCAECQYLRRKQDKERNAP